MSQFDTSTIKENSSFTSDLFLDNMFILAPRKVEISQSLLQALSDWEFSSVFTDDNTEVVDAPQKENDETKEETTSVPNQEIVESSSEVNSSIKKSLEDAERASTLENSEQSRIEAVKNVYNEYMVYINSIYTRYATHKQVNQEELYETIKELCVFIRDNRRYVLRITHRDEKPGLNFLISHSMRSTVVAIAIGLQLHFSLSKLVELGATCILHEIGMIRLPPQFYLTNRRLTPAERIQMLKHPIMGFEIAKALNFPLSIQLGILEHHERENGSGYPRHLIGEKISTYAKIIAVACSFESIISPREYKEEKTTFEAVVEMLKNANHQYDESVIKALLYSVSLFPIGTYVYLVNGEIAQVTDVNPDNPKNPIVQLLRKEKDELVQTIQTNDSDMRIIRPLTKNEIEDVLKSISKK